MTRISQLEILESVAPGTVLPLAQSGSTYQTSVASLNGSASTLNSSFGGVISPDVLVGVPTSLIMISPGKGYTNQATYAMAHADVGGNTPNGVKHTNHGVDDQKNPKKFIARGMHIRVTSLGLDDSVQEFELTNPGQFYKVGDELQLSSWIVKYSSDPGIAGTTDAGITETAKFKVNTIEPFQVYNGMTSPCLGNSMANLYPNGSNTPYDPAVAPQSLDGVRGYDMHEDASASLFLSTEPVETQSSYNPRLFKDAGLRSTWLGSPRVKATNRGAVPDLSSGAGGTEDVISDFELSVALPGDWAVISSTMSVPNSQVGYNNSSSFTFNYGQDVTSNNPYLTLNYSDLVHKIMNSYDITGNAKTVSGIRAMMQIPESDRSFNWVTDGWQTYSRNSSMYYNPHCLSQITTEAVDILGNNVPVPLTTNNGEKTEFNANSHLGYVGSVDGSAKTFWGVWDASLVATTTERGSEGDPGHTIFGQLKSTNPTNHFNGSTPWGQYCSAVHGHSFFFVNVYAFLQELEKVTDDFDSF